MNIAIIGLGYVGLPLSIEFGKKYNTIGYDKSKVKISKYRLGLDPNGEVDSEDFLEAKFAKFTENSDDIKIADIFIIAVPTPVDNDNIPDLTPLIEASKLVALKMKPKSIIVYEPTVYPGATEDICVPILENYSNLIWKKDFNIGYSPERINPGDKERTLTKILKIVSADNENTLKILSDLYSSIVKTGVFTASSIKVAEAAKVLENTQRDLNIALMNELAMICNEIEIDTSEVISVASTKWNFIPFKPGLVGGHCIGVDPYYLTYKAKLVGHSPKVILAGREVNDGMADYVAEKVTQFILKSNQNLDGSKIIVLGITFKEDCSDIRNSKVIDLIKDLKRKGCKVYVHDPLVDPENVKDCYDVDLQEWEDLPHSEIIISAVSHKVYLEMGIKKILSKLSSTGTFMDIKSSFSRKDVEKLGYNVWRL